ncbi:MAG: hypothetical protein ACE5H8_12595 [Alphaproteobacteria bacterium]
METSAEAVGRFEASNRRTGGRRTWLGMGIFFGVTAAALTGVFDAAEWYAGHVSLQRYCADRDAALAQVERVLTVSEPAGAGASRPYVIAAKLVYLVPQRPDETTGAYVSRLRRRLGEACR